MTDVGERVLFLEPLDGSLATTALRDERVPNAADERLALQPELSAEERDSLLLVFQEAPIEVDGSIDGDKLFDRGVDAVVRSEADLTSGERDGGREKNAEVARKGGVTTTRKGAGSKTQGQQENEQGKAVKVNPRRNRKRRKHEVDALRVEAKELAAKLEQLELQQQQVALAGTVTQENENESQSQQSSQLSVITKEKASPSLATASIWESLAWFQREEARTAMKENLGLKSLYQQQLQMLQQFAVLHNIPRSALHGELSFWQQEFNEGALTKRVRVDPFDADFTIFASLGRDFDAQYAKIDSIFASAGLTDFDGRMRRDLVPKRGGNGIYFLESVFSKVIPRDMHEHDERMWTVFSNEQLHSHHGLYEVRARTNDTMFRKIVDTIRLPYAESTSTLVRRTALKRFVEAHRVVHVWDTVIEIVGSVSMRLRERGWKQLRRPHTVAEYHTSGPLALEQACVRITSELSTTYSEQEIVAGSLTNTVVSSFRRHLRSIHHQNKDLFVALFGKMSLHGHRCHKHRHKKCHAAGDSTPPPPRPCSVAL